MAWGDIMAFRKARRLARVLFSLVIVQIAVWSGAAQAALTVTPLTWNIIGLDSNSPTTGPRHFPVGARVCSSVATSNVAVAFVWGSANANVDLRVGSLSTLNFPSIGAGACVDAYFEAAVNPVPAAYDTTRRYHVTATDGTGSYSSPTPRELYVEHLVSQNRNAITNVRYGPDVGNLVAVAPGAGFSLVVGNTYVVELSGGTATQGYEQFESFINFPNAIFQVLSTSTTYSADSTPHVSSPNDKLYGDACLWQNDPNSPIYRACQDAGKIGGSNVVTLYTLRVIGGGGSSQTLNTLLYDFSGSSYHYNADFTVGARTVTIIDPASATIAKRFTPSSVPINGTSTLTITLGNPNPLTQTGLSFTDPLPTGMTVATPANAATSNCGTPTFAPTSGATSLSFSNGTIPANGSCTISVNVTATTVGSLVNTTNHLFVGAADTGNSATATLTVTSAPPPPPGICGLALATWRFPTGFSLTAPAASTASVTVASAVGAGIAPNTQTTITADGTAAWGSNGSITTGASLGLTNDEYFEFGINTTGLSQVSLSFNGQRRSANGPQGIAVYVGTSNARPETGTQLSSNATAIPAQNTTVAFGPITASSGLNPSGLTYFRIYSFNSGNTNPGSDPVIDDVVFTGCGAPQQPTIAKSFSPNPIAAGAASTLSFTVTNPNTAVLNNLSFADSFPSGMTVASPTGTSTTCGGTVSASVGATSMSFSGGTLPSSGTCTVTVNVTSATAGPSTNVSGFVSTTEGGTNAGPGGSAVATLTVLRPPVIAKRFSPNPILAGGVSRLTFTVSNPNPNNAIAGVAFADTFPAPMVVAATPGASTSGCGSPVFSPVAGAGSVSFSGGTIAAGGSCTVAVNVSVASQGSFANTSGTVTHLVNGSPIAGNTASDTLNVVAPNPAIELLKQVGPTASGPWSPFEAIDLPGNVFYRFTIENAGDVPLSPVTLTDPLINTAACAPPATLPVADASDDDHLYTCVVGPVAASNGTHPNTATANGTFSGSPVSAIDTATYATTGLTIDKTATPMTYVSVGQVINYSFLVSNSGAATIDGPITVIDDRSSDEACPALSTIGDFDDFFDPGESLTCTATYTITGADVIAGSVTNIAFATNGVTSSPTDTVTVTAIAPRLVVDKTASVTSIAQNGSYSYGIAVSNTGAADSDPNTTIVDSFVAGVTIGSVTNGAGWVCTPSGALPLAGPASVQCVKAAGVSQGASNEPVATLSAIKTSATSVDNVATITSGDAGCVNPLPSRCTDTVTVTDAGAPNLVVAKSASVASIAQNGAFTYTVTVSNTGAIVSAANTTIVDSFVAGISITAISSGAGWVCTPSGALPLAGPSSISCVKAAGVNAGAANEVVAAFNATKTSIASVDNTVTITSGDPACVNPLPAHCTDTVTVTDASEPNLIVAKSASVSSATQNGAFTYTVAISNSGPVISAANTTIVDNFVAGVSITAIANGSGWVCTPSGALPLAGPASLSCVKAAGVSAGASNEVVATFNATKTSTGDVDNTATITSGDPACVSPLPARCTDTVTVTDASQPNLIVAKSASVASAAQNGTFTYTVAVSNSGAVVSGANTTIVDNFVAGVSITAITNGSGWVCTPSGALPLAGPSSMTCVKAAGVSAGASNEVVATFNATKTSTASVDNTATITSGDPACVSPLPARCTDTVTVTDASQPNLIVAKSASVASTAQNGTFTYTVAASNSGPVDSGANTTIVDNFVAGASITAIANGAGWVCTPSGALPLAGPASINCVKAAGVSAGASNEVVATFNATKTSTGDVDNTAAITSGDPACVSPLPARCTDTVTVTDASQPNLIVAKSASVASAAQNGTLTYTVAVSNSGAVVSGANTTIVDNFVAGVSITAIANGSGWVCTPSGVLPLAGPSSISCVKAAGVSAGASNEVVATFNATKTSTASVDNTATITSGDPACVSPLPTRCTDTVTVTDASQPNLIVAKTASVTSVAQNGTFNYTVTASNSGPVDSSANTTIVDNFVAGVSITAIANGSGWVCTPSGVLPLAGPSSISCVKAAGVSAGASNEVVATFNATKTSTSSVDNTATITSGDPTCVSPLPARCTDTVTVNDASQPNLIVAKSASVASTAQNGTFTYTVAVSNSGPVDSNANTSIVDNLVSGISITAISNGAGWICTPSGALPLAGPASISCMKAAGVSAGASNEVVATFNATKTSTASVDNTATITSGDPACVSPLPARCTDTVTVTDASQPNLVVSKSASVASIAQNGAFTYTVTASNSGPVDSSANTTIVDNFVAGVSITAIANGSGWVCTPSGVLLREGSGRERGCKQRSGRHVQCHEDLNQQRRQHRDDHQRRSRVRQPAASAMHRHSHRDRCQSTEPDRREERECRQHVAERHLQLHGRGEQLGSRRQQREHDHRRQFRRRCLDHRDLQRGRLDLHALGRAAVGRSREHQLREGRGRERGRKQRSGRHVQCHEDLNQQRRQHRDDHQRRSRVREPAAGALHRHRDGHRRESA